MNEIWKKSLKTGLILFLISYLIIGVLLIFVVSTANKEGIILNSALDNMHKSSDEMINSEDYLKTRTSLIGLNLFGSYNYFLLLSLSAIIVAFFSIPSLFIRNVTQSSKKSRVYLFPLIYFIIISLSLFGLYIDLKSFMNYFATSLIGFAIPFFFIFSSPIIFITIGPPIICFFVLLIASFLCYKLDSLNASAQRPQYLKTKFWTVILIILLLIFLCYFIFKFGKIEYAQHNYEQEREAYKIQQEELRNNRTIYYNVKNNFQCIINTGIQETTLFLIYDSSDDNYNLNYPYPDYKNELVVLEKEGYKIFTLDISNSANANLYYSCIDQFTTIKPDIFCSNIQVPYSSYKGTSIMIFASYCMPWVGQKEGNTKLDYYD